MKLTPLDPSTRQCPLCDEWFTLDARGMYPRHDCTDGMARLGEGLSALARKVGKPARLIGNGRCISGEQAGASRCQCYNCRVVKGTR